MLGPVSPCNEALVGATSRPNFLQMAGQRSVIHDVNDNHSSENSHNPFPFNGRFAAIFMVRLWLERAMTYS